MADYKRMVSYMYQYENGVKRKNVGYARIESKGGQCKITLHMQLLGQLDSIFPTYLIQRNEEGMELIYLGDTLLKNQVMDSRLMAEETNIMGTGYALSDMGGLLLFLNENIFFATEWDDKVIIANEVIEALKPKKKDALKQVQSEAEYIETAKQEQAVDKENEHEKKVLETKVLETKVLEEKILEEKVLEEKALEERVSEEQESEVRESEEEVLETDMSTISDPDMDPSQDEYSLEDELKMPVYRLPRGYKTIERLQRPGSENSDAKVVIEAANIIKEDQIQQSYEETAADVMEEATSHDINNVTFFETYQTDQRNTSEEQKLTSEVMRAEKTEEFFYQSEDAMMSAQTEETDFTMQSDGVDFSMQSEKVDFSMQTKKSEDSEQQEEAEMLVHKEDVSMAERSEDSDMSEQPENQTAQYFFDHFTRIYPFEDNEIILCVKIEPKDIGMLPKDTWALSNNSFLMHGYYCYHHLVFAKMKDKYGYHYILGIPGIYHNRERFMARMFGFEYFKSIRKRDLRLGDFGYWFMEIKMD